MSLRRIVLRDFVIVNELDLDLDTGFTVLTGETGAGKSILIDALQLVTGGRADIGVIREGTNRADVSAEFDVNSTTVTWLAQFGFESAGVLLLRRTVDSQGKSRAWINGSPATATQLREIGQQLLDIHGQHAWQSLTEPESIRALLDAYGQITTSDLVNLWHKWRLAQGQLSQATAAQDSMQIERERLMWQIGELSKLAPQPQEWESLNTEHARLSNAQTLIDAAQSASQALDDDDSSALQRLHLAHQQLQQQEHLEPIYKDLASLLESALAQVEDTVHSLRGYLRNVDLDPDRLSALDERIALWVSLARRYKRAPAELPDLQLSWSKALQDLDEATNLSVLQKAESTASSAFVTEANRVSKARHKAAPRLARAVSNAMQDLGMQGGQFEVKLQNTAQPMASGLDEVSFLVAGHAGSTPKPVNKVASGGELSRIALAIAVTTSQLGTAQTLIFDEVDAGIGGAVAETVGRLMKQLGVDRQVLAVTHLPQVAACADHHWLVSKRLQGESTLSFVSEVTGEVRVAEVARMLGGERLSGTSQAHAREMLQLRP
ncbi:DNA repair protein RecN [Rhodoferax sp. PAMC 29310]|uniref:DNA repair protein RecN n=1 Tax=Rhodoferax sp. PAMC 29310 TaxID=2822760 RepID=UPI001B33BE2E|nr:DNA repair protein RecN [Rhodoferax sp. PAMC 29310]